MSRIRARNSKPELAVRSALHSRGFRFRLHRKDLPGTPDLVFPKHHAVILVNGCFWHGHKCHLFKWPKSRIGFWRSKINSNIERDHSQLLALDDAGWRVAVIWECALKGRTRIPIEEIADICSKWLISSRTNMGLSGNEIRTSA